MDCSPSGSSVHGILQARLLEWVTVCFSRGSSRTRDWTCVSCIVSSGFFTAEPPGTPWFHCGLVAQSCPTLCDLMDCSCQAPLSVGFPRQEYWSGLPFRGLLVVKAVSPATSLCMWWLCTVSTCAFPRFCVWQKQSPQTHLYSHCLHCGPLLIEKARNTILMFPE